MPRLTAAGAIVMSGAIRRTNIRTRRADRPLSERRIKLRDVRLLLNVFLMERALEEVGRELMERPAWVVFRCG